MVHSFIFIYKNNNILIIKFGTFFAAFEMRKIIDSAITKHGKFFFPRYDVGVGDSLREYGEFSEAELILMLSFINEGDTVLDIGSNIGAFTIPFAKKVGFKGKVYAFEPQSFIFRILKENVKINKLSNIEIF